MVYTCKLAVYTCKLAVYSGLQVSVKYLVLDPNCIMICLCVICCKVAVYTCKLADYTCKVLNSMFTTVLLITLLGHCGGNTFLSIFFVKQWFTCVNCCFFLKLPVNQQFTVKQWFRTCKVVVYSKAAVYNL